MDHQWNENKHQKQTWFEEIEVAGDKLISRVKELIRQGNVKKLIIRKPGGKRLLSIPLTAGVAAGGIAIILAPVFVTLGLLAGAIAKFKIEVIRTN